jgi:hypothetical protein
MALFFPLAIREVTDDERMLLMATQLAHEADPKNVHLSALQELVDFAGARNTTEMNAEPAT